MREHQWKEGTLNTRQSYYFMHTNNPPLPIILKANVKMARTRKTMIVHFTLTPDAALANLREPYEADFYLINHFPPECLALLNPRLTDSLSPNR